MLVPAAAGGKAMRPPQCLHTQRSEADGVPLAGGAGGNGVAGAASAGALNKVGCPQ